MLQLFCILFYCCSQIVSANSFSQCDHLIKDILFVVDASQSISTENFKIALGTVKSMISVMNIGPDNNRVAFMVFGNEPDLQFNLDAHSNVADILKHIDKATNHYSLTGIGKALNLSLNEVYPKMRDHASKFLFLFTDGSNNMYPAPYMYSDQLKLKNVRIIGVGIGDSIRMEELTKIASDNLAVKVSGFDKLLDSMTKVVAHLCPLPDPSFPRPCEFSKLDFVIVQDSSNSIPADKYVLAKNFAFDMFSRLFESNSRFAYVQFSEAVKVEFNLDTYSNLKDIKAHINKAKQFGSATAIGKGLMAVEQEILKKKRPDVDMIVLLVTDGYNNMWPKPEIVADRLKKTGVKFITLGVGSDINIEELRKIATASKYYTVESFDDMPAWHTRVSLLAEVTCNITPNVIPYN